ncbi:MAG TPA: M48 family metallopeptidase [Thermoplasmata archaeon]|nr:M48 family metallopeptidase [Thermoplasmata archaeon]
MGTDAWGFDEERQELARKLRRKRRRYSWSHTGVLLVYLAVLLAGESVALRSWIATFVWPSWGQASVFLMVVYTIGSALGWPYAYVGGFLLERSFGLLTQSRRSWVSDLIKSYALGLVAILAAGNVVIWLLAAYPTTWWLLAWLLGILVTWVLGFLAPVVIAPLFYRFRPLENPTLRSRFEALAARAGVPVLGVFEMGASAKTRRSNAAVMGFGRTRRIVITDTMLHAYTPEEIEAVLAHELGHQKHRDPLTGVIVGAGISFVMWSIAAFVYTATYPAFGIASLADAAGLPLLVLYAGLVSAALEPLELWWSRHREAGADRFSLEVTRNSRAFAGAMVRLHDQNLSIAHPRSWEKWLLYSHPPGSERIEAARAFGERGSPSG